MSTTPTLARPTPADIYDTRPRGFVQVAVAPPGATIITSGMVGYDRDWRLTGDGGFEAQLRQVAANLQSQTFRSFEIYIVVTGIYLALALSFSALFKLIYDRALNYPDRR